MTIACMYGLMAAQEVFNPTQRPRSHLFWVHKKPNRANPLPTHHTHTHTPIPTPKHSFIASL